VTSQAKRLKALLKKHGIASSYGKLSVTTQVHRYKSGDREWGNAVAHVRELTKEEIAKLVAEDPYISVTTIRGKNGFSIVKSGGSTIWETTFKTAAMLEQWRMKP